MTDRQQSSPPIETKIFDPRDRSTASGESELCDPTLALRDRWWLCLAGQAHGHGATDLYSASLPPGAPLAAAGWQLSRDQAGVLTPVAGRSRSSAWDANGGRHCPSFVKGRNPRTGEWVDRIYYAGAVENPWGPYTIGFLEWDGEHWLDQATPAFVANEEWEHGSVYEPNLIYHDGKWKMWYVAGSNLAGYLVHGYAESEDGLGGWSKHRIFTPPEMKLFDFCVRERAGVFEAIFSRVAVGADAASDTGLWWCKANNPAGTLSDWGEPVQIMTAADRGWHSGPWKPSFHFDSSNSRRAFVFFSGSYQTSDPGPFPFAFTLGCLEIDLPD